jgi:tRNA(Arg) A34 adenosine deaminase TadA
MVYFKQIVEQPQSILRAFLVGDILRDKGCNLLMEHHKRFLEAAYAVALAGPGAGGKTGYRLGAVIVNRKKIEVAKFNCLKSHPKLCKYYEYPYLHAEASCILSLGLDNCADKSIYVVRVRKDGTTALAKPCSSCQRLIADVGIKKVYYSTLDGFESYGS